MKIATTIFGALLPCIFLAGITGAWIETNWAFLYLGLGIAVCFTKIRMTEAHWLVLALFIWAALSFWWSPSFYQSVEGLLKFCVVIGGFVFAAEMDDPKPLLRGLGIGIGINGILALGQLEGLNWVYQTYRPAGFLVNPDTFAETSALVVILLASERMLFPWGLMAWPGLLFTGSRAGWLVLGVFGLVLLWARSKLLASAVGIASFAALAVASYQRFSSSQQRLDIWLDTLGGINIFGHGIGSFGYLYPAYAIRQNIAIGRPIHAHSDVLELGFELGIIGLAIAALFMALVFWRTNPMGRAVLIANVALVTLSFPLHVPVSTFLFGIMAGLCVNHWSLRKPVFDLSRLQYAKGLGKRQYATDGIGG